MQSLKKFYFGKSKYKPNTFIGGVSATLNTPTLVATRLGISVSRIKAFSISGSNIQFAVIGGSYEIPNSAFSGNTNLTFFNDINGLVTKVNIDSFYGCTSVSSYSFSNLTTIASGGVSGASIAGTFRNNTSLVTFSAPLLSSITGWSTFRGCSVLATLQAPNLSTLGASTADNLVFESIKTGCQITVKASLQTANGGAPDGDLVYASGTRGAIITYV